MSWDIYVQDVPENVVSVEDVPDDFMPRPIGKRSDIIARIKQVIPNVDFSNPILGQIEGLQRWRRYRNQILDDKNCT